LKSLKIESMKIVSRICLSLIGFLFVTQLSASHIMGGEITWECLPSGMFRFEMKIYRDCNGISLNGNNETLVGHYGAPNIPVTLISATDISPDCAPGSGVELSCGAGPPFVGFGGNGSGAVQENIYRSVPIMIAGTPPAGGWIFTWDSCCRNNSVDNLIGPSGTGHTLRAIMYRYIPPGAVTPLNTSPCYDSSPRFTETANTVICTGYPFTYNHNAVDNELDSLYYDWADPLDDMGFGSFNPPTNPSVVNWATGYSTTSPLPSATQNPANVPAALDYTSGQISYTSFTSGNYVTCIKVEAWKCNQLVAEIYRDIQITLIACTSANFPPSLIVTPTPGSVPITINGRVISATAIAGDNVSFSMNATDFDFQPVTFLPQNIQFAASGGQLGVPLSNANAGCLNPPCATITPGPGQTGFVSPSNNQINFNWDTDCNHLAVSNGCGSFQNTYTFALRMQDDFCPAPAISIATLKVTVVADPSDAPLMNCVGVGVSGDIDLSWTAPSDTGYRFNYYVIYYKDNSAGPTGVFNPIDTVQGWANTTATLAGLPNNGDGLYYIRSNGMCGFLSAPSDTIGIMFLNVNAPPPPNNNMATLTWTGQPGGANYEVWAESPPSAGNWVQVSSTTDTSFVVNSSFCNAEVNFQIRIPLNGVICGSSKDSALFFDGSNTDIMSIDSASVGSGGLATLSWGASPSGDVIEYYVMLFDRTSGLFNIIDTVAVGTPMPYINLNSTADVGPETYRVISIDSCGNQSDDLAVIRHKTMHLRNYLDKCTGVNSLTWSSYDGFNVDEYRVMVEVTLPNGTALPPVLLNLQNGNDSTFTQTGLIKDYTYCYYIRAVDTINDVTTISNRICFKADVPNRSRLLYLAQTSVVPAGIETYTFLDGQADVVSFDVERADNPRGPFISLGTVPKPANAPFVFSFTDFSANTEGRLYWYRISALDSCGLRDTVSNVGRNIFLEVSAEKDLSNRLKWNPYQQWGGTVGSYRIWRSETDKNFGYQLVATIPGTDTTYSDYFSSTDGSGLFCYYIEAEEVNNPLGFVDPLGQPWRSKSNNVCAVQKARFFMPNAFNPASDIEENRLFGPREVFAQSASYRFYIVNRWGEVVFDTSDPANKWDGMYEGSDAPTGVYLYYVTYRSLEDIPVEQRGHMTLIR